MGLSSNILWHQTSYNALRNILKSKQVRFAYSVESTFSIVNEDGMAFPMISLCDLPLSEFGSYLGKYGDYSIGFTKEWGESNKACPVWYCYNNGDIIDTIRNFYASALQNQSHDSIRFIINLLSYVKPVQGPLNKKNYKTYRFYDEREVRMVPDIDELKSDGRSKILSPKEYDDYKKENGSSLLDLGVSFDWKDVEYIVVKDKAQVVRTKGMLLGDGCDNDNINVLYSSQIKEDIIGIDHNEIIEKPNQASLELSDKLSRGMRAIISGNTNPEYWNILLESMGGGK